MFGLPDDVRGCLFDLDGVLTQTAKVHGTAWKEMFDGYLCEHAQQSGQPFVPLGAAGREEYVDGKPHADGTRSFLVSRGIELGFGFGFVVGVDRVGQAEALKEHGADIVAADLAELMEHR